MSTETPAFIAPLSITFPIDGPDAAPQDVTVTAANVGQLGRMLTLLAPVLHELMLLPPDMMGRLVSDAGPTHGDVLELLELVSKQPDLAVQMVSIGTGLQTSYLAQLLPDRFAYLFAVVVQVNADFFARARPGLLAAAGKFSAVSPVHLASTAPLTSGPASSAS